MQIIKCPLSSHDFVKNSSFLQILQIKILFLTQKFLHNFQNNQWGRNFQPLIYEYKNIY